ncbi:MAG: hypothetical protein LBQ79_14685, partial [Deltaproteobacteria bacterium]|nr:hypothetical protein [Deltaproteobacteria bacterium]
MSKNIITAAALALLALLALSAAPASAYFSVEIPGGSYTIGDPPPYGPDKADYSSSPFMSGKASIPYVLIV